MTSLDRQTIAKQALYEQLYCARGDMENGIKEQQLWLFADGTSGGDDARQSIAAVLLCLCRHPDDDPASRGTAGHRTRRGTHQVNANADRI